MTQFKSILVATDFSEAAHNAVRRAALIAAEHDARMTLLKVVDPSDARPLGSRSKSTLIDQKVAQAHAALGRHAAEIADRHDVHVRTEVQVGDALQHVCAMGEDADLLVVAASSPKRFKDHFFPTAAERLSRLLRRPVLVTKQPVQGRYRSVLVPVDFTATSEVAVHTAMALAPSARVHLFHALSRHPSARLRADVPPALVRQYEDRDRQKGVHRLRSMVASPDHARINVSADHGDPARLTVEKQKKILADLVVMGKNGRSALRDFLLGSVANRALWETDCDVLVIPATSVPGRVIGARRARHGSGPHPVRPRSPCVAHGTPSSAART